MAYNRYRQRKAKERNEKLQSWGREIAMIIVGGLFAGSLLFFHLAPKPSPLSRELQPFSSPQTSATREPDSPSSKEMKTSIAPLGFAKCGATRRTCVVDGDTIWLEGKKIRIADIDTPEISQPKCQSEYNRGMKATYRLIELLNQGPFQLQPYGHESQDIYGRELLVITRDGKSIGAQLVSEGLARTWTGHRLPWC